MKTPTVFSLFLRKLIFSLLFILGSSLFTLTNAQIITTFAGNGTAGYSGDGGQATSAELDAPDGVAYDATGINIYISDATNNVVRKVNSNGIITTFAGNGTAGYSGDGGAATSAELHTPHGITVDASGNVYFADQVNNRIRKVNTSGIISTFAGNGTAGYSGDGGAATSAELNGPTEITFDASGNAYIADKSNNVIRKVNTSGTISTVAGTGNAGFSGDGGAATLAKLNAPSDVYVDGSGNMFIMDQSNNRVRKVNTSGTISTFAGNGTAGYSGDGGAATAAEIHASGVREDAAGNVYIGDLSNERVRMVNTSGTISTFAGNGTAGYSGDGGQATSAELDHPGMMTFDASGNIYFTEGANNIIREVYLSLKVTTNVTANVSCNGGSNGSASSTPTQGTTPYTYSWAPGGQTTSSITGLTAGTYTITVTDANNITGSAIATVTQPTALSVSATAKNSAICPGSSDSLYSTVSGGTAPYTYSWTAPFGDISCTTCQNTNSYPYGTPYTFSGSYVTDVMGCSATASVSITIHPFPYVTISGPLNPIAAGRSDTLIATAAGATYLWSNSATTSSIIVSPSVPTTYFVTATNTYSCYDTAHYTIDTNTIGTGTSSSSPIRIVPSSYVNPVSFSSIDSVVWFSFVPTDSNNQIIAYSNFLGYPVPHVHRLTLYNPSKHMLVDESMPEMVGANQIRIDISHLKIDSTYYVRAARTPADSNMSGCNPTPATRGECNESMRWDFRMAFRTVPVFVPKDSASEPPAVTQLYYECRGQIQDLNKIPRFDLKAYTNFATPAVYCSDSAVSFVYSKRHTNPLIADTIHRVDMVLTGSALQPFEPVFKMEEDSSAGYLNYFQGLAPDGISKVEGYSRLVYKNVYSNVDMQVYSNNEGTKLYFVCNPGGTGGVAGNPADIELEFKGANSVTVNSDSGLSVVTALGTLSFAPGYAYEDSAGIIVPKSWHANFEAVNFTTVKFHTATYNTSEPLIIEVDRGHNFSSSYPAIQNLEWCTYFGGSSTNAQGQFNDVTNDASGNVFATGWTNASNFPVLASDIQTTGLAGGKDVVVAAFNSSDGALWSTYVGGSSDDEGMSITASGGYAFVTGYTKSTNFPFKIHDRNPYHQSTLNGPGGQNAFVFQTTSGGTYLYWSTYFGGSGYESGNHIALDNTNSYIYVVGGGANSSTPLNTEAGAMNNTYPGGGFILKFALPNDNWSWGTTIGSGTAGDNTTLNGCAVDATGNLYVTGTCDPAYSSGYPVTTYGYSNAGAGLTNNAIATAFNTSNAIAWSTYYGGNGGDEGNAITVDGSGNSYITGYTNSPYTAGHNIELARSGSVYYQNSNGNGVGNTGAGNAFIAEFAPISSGTPGQLEWGTYFGGASDIMGLAITIDADNNLYMTGRSAYTPPSDYGLLYPGGGDPVNYYDQSSIGNYEETYLAAFNSTGFWWGTQLGGGDGEVGLGISDYNASNLYVVGYTGTSNNTLFPLVSGPAGAAFYPNSFAPATLSPYISEFNISGNPTGITPLTDSEDGVTVFPNPTSQEVTVKMESEKEQDVEFILYNLFGQPVYSQKVNEPQGSITNQISLSMLPNGNYILQVVAGTNVYHAKITKLQ